MAPKKPDEQQQQVVDTDPDALTPEELTYFEQHEKDSALGFPDVPGDGGPDGNDGRTAEPPAGDGDGAPPTQEAPPADPPVEATPPAAQPGEGTPPAPDAQPGGLQIGDGAQPAPSQTPPADAPPATPEGEGDGEPKMVNLAALQESRRETREVKAKLTEMEERFARGDERLKVLLEGLQPKKADEPAAEPPDPAPDPEEDAFAYMAWQGRQIERLNKRLDETNQGVQQTQQRQTAQEDTQQLVTTYHQSAVRAAQANPRWKDGYDNLVARRYAQYDALGYDDKEIPGLVQQEELSLVRRAITQGKDPAEMIYNMAVASGFDPNAAPVPPPSDPPADPPPNGAGQQATPSPAPNGQQPPAQQPPAQQPPPDQIQQLMNTDEAATSLSSVPGSAGGQTITLESLSQMSDEQFANLANQLKPGELDQIMGA